VNEYIRVIGVPFTVLVSWCQRLLCTDTGSSTCSSCPLWTSRPSRRSVATSTGKRATGDLPSAIRRARRTLHCLPHGAAGASKACTQPGISNEVGVYPTRGRVYIANHSRGPARAQETARVHLAREGPALPARPRMGRVRRCPLVRQPPSEVPWWLPCRRFAPSVRQADINWARDRSTLWNAAERAGRRNDARLAKEVIVFLPSELTPSRRTRLALTFARQLADRYRKAVDLAVHDPHLGSDERHHHAHLLHDHPGGDSGWGRRTGLMFRRTDLPLCGGFAGARF